LRPHQTPTPAARQSGLPLGCLLLATAAVGAAAASQPAKLGVAAPAAPAVAAVCRLGQMPAVLQHLQLPGALLLSLVATAGYGAGTAAGWLQGGLHCWVAQGRCAGRVCAGLGAGADLLLQLGPHRRPAPASSVMCHASSITWHASSITSRKQATRGFFASCCMTELKLIV
jgi:hypothetical protein